MENTIKQAARIARETTSELYAKSKSLLKECLKSEGLPFKLPTSQKVKEWYQAHCEEVREWDAAPKVVNAPPHTSSTGTHNGVSKFSALG